MKKQEYADLIIKNFKELLTKKNSTEWVKTWRNAYTKYRNGTSDRAYTGMNALVLSLLSRNTDKRYYTFNEIVDKGYTLIKGSHGFPIEYWLMYDKAAKKFLSWDRYNQMAKEEKAHCVLMAKYYYVFNAEDIEGVPAFENEEKPADLNAEILGKVAAKMGIQVYQTGNKAYYKPIEDTINVPPLSQFDNKTEWESTLTHELIHATGAKNRLNREIINKYGTCEYALEELTAELSAAILNQSNIDNHMAYLQGWLEACDNQPKAVMTAIRNAMKAVAYIENIVNELPTEEPKAETIETVKTVQPVAIPASEPVKPVKEVLSAKHRHTSVKSQHDNTTLQDFFTLKKVDDNRNQSGLWELYKKENRELILNVTYRTAMKKTFAKKFTEMWGLPVRTMTTAEYENYKGLSA